MNRDRLIRTALLASVGLNLFLLGTMVPRWLGPKPPHADKIIMAGPEGPGGPIGPGAPFFAMRRMLDDLPESDAKILKDHFGSDMEKFQDKARSFRDRIDRLRDLMRADPFDAAALRTELDSAAEEREGMEKAQTDAIVEVLGKLSPEGRRRLADIRAPRMMERRMPPPPGGIPLDADRAPMAAPPPPPPGEGGR
ncbi:periplasmic heavy metal sensor [Niveispirillum sp. KHB5.9]|uniref:periplasmic heavy metal sensor n=1 Tax=Niveispirillum sp. KHB5.9 TaxID=3400269 RepID=UPI003A8BDE30